MTHHPPIDYATARGRPISAAQRRLIALACCLGASWLGWLLLYKASTFPTGFEDEVFQWPEAVFIMAFPGTLCGMLLYVLVLMAMYVRYLSAKRSRGSAS